MANQIVLAWTVSVSGTPFGPAAAALALAAVPLYANPVTDPVLGQFFGLTVDSDNTVAGAGSATRTLTLNLDSVNAPEAPPPFPCHPRTSTPPVLPYPLRRAVPLLGSFLPTNGSAVVAATVSPVGRISIGDVVQFLSQPGVFYTVLLVGAASITLTAVYTGTTKNTGAFKEVAAPVTSAAFYSTSPLDTSAIATIPAGPGARTVELTYDDSVGGGPFTVTVALTGKRPAAVVLDAGSVDIAEIINITVATYGSFDNSVGQITLSELTGALAAVPAGATPNEFRVLTDEAQLRLGLALAYLPPSYFALAQQGSSQPPLAGDFIVTTGSKTVFTTEDQTAVLAAGNTIQFAERFENDPRVGPITTTYTIDAVGPKSFTLTAAFASLGADKKAFAAMRVTPSPAAPPTNAQLSGPLAQYVEPEVAGPPPDPPFPPATIPTPTFLSDLFAQTLRVALKMPVTPQAIVLI